MPAVPADPVQIALQEFESPTRTFDEASVGDALRKIPQEVIDAAAKPGCWAEWAAAIFWRVEDGRSVWGTAFGPMMTYRNDRGEQVNVPNVREADATTLEYWKKRCRETTSPILRARYADLVWDLSR